MPCLKSPLRNAADPSAARFRRLVCRLRRKRILVIGDLMLDEFIWGKVSRISPEAPVPVVNVTGESYYPGGAANVARNLREFTAASRRHGPRRAPIPTATACSSCWRKRGIDTSACWRPCAIHHRQDPDHRPQPAGGARGPRTQRAAHAAADAARHRPPGRARSPASTASSSPITARAFSRSRWPTTSATPRGSTAKS